MNSKTHSRPIVRRIEKADAQSAFELQKQLFPGDVNSLSADEFASADQSTGVIVLVAELNKAIVGFLVLRSRNSRPWTGIDFVGVSANASGKGIGAQLLDAARMVSPRPVLRLFVRPTNAAARALYQRAGFRHGSTRSANYPDGEDALILMKWVGFRPFRRKPAQINAPDLIKA
jgi:[ribosomal protein S18]-alanine N-acetyltransferase